MDISIWYYLISVVIIIAVWAFTKRLSAGILAGYVFIFLAVTVLSRTTTEMRWEIVPFWSYRMPELKEQILWNVVAFIPVGVLGAILLRWKGILVGIGISALVELIQLFTMRGLFEFDDIIHNTIGTAIGVVLWMVVSQIRSQEMR